MASSLCDSDRVRDLALISSSDASTTNRNVLEAQDSDNLPCVILIPKEQNDISARLDTLPVTIHSIKTQLKVDFSRTKWSDKTCAHIILSNLLE